MFVFGLWTLMYLYLVEGFDVLVFGCQTLMYLYLLVGPLCIFTCLWDLDMAESECGGEVWSPGVPTSYSTIPTHHNLNFQNNYKLENGKYKYNK